MRYSLILILIFLLVACNRNIEAIYTSTDSSTFLKSKLEKNTSLSLSTDLDTSKRALYPQIPLNRVIDLNVWGYNYKNYDKAFLLSLIKAKNIKSSSIILSFYDSKMDPIAPLICNLPNIEKVELSHKKASPQFQIEGPGGVYNSLTNLKNVKNLVLINANVDTKMPIPWEQFDLKKITYLNLSIKSDCTDPNFNWDQCFQPEMWKLSNLKHLGISGRCDGQQSTVSSSQFNLPKEIGQLENLTELFIHDFNNTKLPSEIKGLQQLVTLELLNLAALSSIPETFKELKNLKNLHLDNSFDTSMVVTASKLSTLETLSLKNNQLKTLDNAFLNLNNLRTLSLSSNQLATLPKGLGTHLNKLVTLELDKNTLTVFPAEILKLDDLTTLKLNNNQLKTIPKAISKLSKLKRLSLFNNPIPKKEIEALKKAMPNTLIID